MIQWYPGHMAKAKRILKEDLKLVDLVVELLDARIPISSRNPDLNQLLDEQLRVIALNKIDLADGEITEQWAAYFAQEYPVVKVNSLTGQGIKELLALISARSVEINHQVKNRGRKQRDIRIMILGIPNVGKSALINVLAGSNFARTGDRPGVTRGRQWITVGKDIQLLDTPGILWPKFANEDIAYKLALTGAIKDEIFDTELAALKLVEYLEAIDSSILETAYELKLAGEQAYTIIEKIGRKRGCLMSGGKVDFLRASKLLINDFRKGKLGPVSLESPSMEEEEIES